MSNEYYLKEGPLTKATPLLIQMAEEIKGKEVDLIFNTAQKVIDTLSSFKGISPVDELILKEYQQRTAEEIIKSGYVFGCSDYGLVFVTLARIKGIPSKFIHCIDIVPFKINQSQISGHVYAECWINKDRYLVDVVKGLVIKIFTDKDKIRMYKMWSVQLMVEAYSGLDNQQAGVMNHIEMLSTLKKAGIEYLGQVSI